MLVFRKILRTYLMDDSFPNIPIFDYYLQVHLFSNIIEHGQTSCSFADEDMLIDEIERAAKETPDEITRVQEFETDESNRQFRTWFEGKSDMISY